jgi:hypothetical protein
MSHIYRSRSLRTRVRRIASCLLRWGFDNLIVMGAPYWAMPPDLLDDPRLDDDLVGWAAGRVTQSGRGRREHQNPDVGPRTSS